MRIRYYKVRRSSNVRETEWLLVQLKVNIPEFILFMTEEEQKLVSSDKMEKWFESLDKKCSKKKISIFIKIRCMYLPYKRMTFVGIMKYLRKICTEDTTCVFSRNLKVCESSIKKDLIVEKGEMKCQVNLLKDTINELWRRRLEPTSEYIQLMRDFKKFAILRWICWKNEDKA